MGRLRKSEIKKLRGALILLILFAASALKGLEGGFNESDADERIENLSEYEIEGATRNTADRADSNAEKGILEVEFIDIGQADSTLISCGGESMLIDAGENDTGEELSEYIRSKGISELKYAIGTHPHSDHIGGMDDVLDSIDCDVLMMPDYERDIKTYTEVLESAEENGTEIINPEPGDSFNLGGASFTIIWPDSYADYGDNINNYSIALLLENGDTSFLFTGDAEEAEEEDIIESAERLGLDMDVDVYKAGHHGSSTATSWDLLEAFSPEYVVISCGRNNEYGFPHDSTLRKLETIRANVYRTDKQGNITAVSDGEKVSFDKEPVGYSF